MTTTSPEALAAAHDLPAFNVHGDPLTTCRNHGGLIYAVAELGADRDLCADCREAKARERITIMDAPGRPADARVTRDQIGAGVLMSCGARDYVRDDKNGLFMFRVGPNGKRVAKVLVKLMPSDLYAVEYGYADMRPSRLSDPTWGEWQTVEQEYDVPAERLAAVVRALGDREDYF